MNSRVICALGVLALGACVSGPMATIDLDRVPIVYGGGAAVRTSFRVSGEQWGGFVEAFAACTDAAGERRAVGGAIGRMERIAGEQTITWMDKACNGNGGPTEQGQMDCIDESTNTDVYLRLFEQRGLLRFHRVLRPVWRAPHVIDTHRTAVIEDIADGRRYAVDSWYLDNGFPAYIQPLEDWLRKVPFPAQ